jgi:hypothetical protein
MLAIQQKLSRPLLYSLSITQYHIEKDMMLRITITDPIDRMYKILKDTLVYLETPECRRTLPDHIRRAEIIEYTKRFREQLIIRQKAINLAPCDKKIL